MVTISVASGVFGTGYYTDYHHTDQTSFDAATLSSFKIDRFFIELSHDPSDTSKPTPTLRSTGTLTFTDTGTVQDNATVDGVAYNDVSSAHIEPLTGAQFNVGDFAATSDTGSMWDFVTYPRLIGLRFDSYQGSQEGSPVVGYIMEMQNNSGGAVTFFMPTADQNLSQIKLPYPSGLTEPGGYSYSVITHFDELTDYDSEPNGTYVAYGDLYDGLPSQFTGAVCFTKGTQINTIKGKVNIEDIRIGDMVWTLDNGYQAVRWIAATTLSARDLHERETLRPIRIQAGALAANEPEVDLIVSPQHRIYLRSGLFKDLCDATEVLVPAKDLVGQKGVRRMTDETPVTYFHLMFDDHEIVMANGCLTESFFTGPEALRSIPNATRSELFDLFPELMTLHHLPQKPARPFIKGKRARTVIARHFETGIYSRG